MTKIIVAVAAASEPQEHPIKDFFLADDYKDIKRLAKFVIDNKPDTTPRSAARDLLNGKYESQKQVNADVKLVADHAVVIIRNLQKKVKQ